MCDFCVALALPMPAGIGSLSRETAIAFASSHVRRVETAIAFAGEKRAFLMQLSGAEVMAVSMGAVQRRAVVTVVSRWPVSVAAEVLLVSKLARRCVLCAKKFALRGLVCVSAKKFALQAQNGRNTLFSGVSGEFFRATGVAGMPCDYR